jgi:dephospho-CoA kinase
VLKIGLTGGIASGKSTVAELFSELGVPIVDTDIVARDLTTPGSPALARIVEAFGPEVLTDTGELDRRRLRQIVFAAPERRRELERILHPLIRAETLARAAQAEGPYVLIAVPLLFESGFDQLVDRSLVVDCPEELQIERLIARDGISNDEALAMLAAQMPREQRRAAADDVIDNAGDLAALRTRVAALDRKFRQQADNCS